MNTTCPNCSHECHGSKKDCPAPLHGEGEICICSPCDCERCQVALAREAFGPFEDEEAPMDMIASTVDLGNLKLSLNAVQQAQLDSALRMTKELAMQDAAQKIIRAICPLCDLADKSPKEIELASQKGDGIHFWHRCRLGGTDFRRCLADPIRQLQWVKL